MSFGGTQMVKIKASGFLKSCVCSCGLVGFCPCDINEYAVFPGDCEI